MTRVPSRAGSRLEAISHFGFHRLRHSIVDHWSRRAVYLRSVLSTSAPRAVKALPLEPGAMARAVDRRCATGHQRHRISNIAIEPKAMRFKHAFQASGGSDTPRRGALVMSCAPWDVTGRLWASARCATFMNTVDAAAIGDVRLRIGQRQQGGGT